MGVTVNQAGNNRLAAGVYHLGFGPDRIVRILPDLQTFTPVSL